LDNPEEELAQDVGRDGCVDNQKNRRNRSSAQRPRRETRVRRYILMEKDVMTNVNAISASINTPITFIIVGTAK